MDFHLAVRQYKGGVIDPKGNKYLQKFSADSVPVYDYRVGKFNFRKELLFQHDADRLIIKYTFLDDSDEVALQVEPLLAFSMSCCSSSGLKSSFPTPQSSQVKSSGSSSHLTPCSSSS